MEFKFDINKILKSPIIKIYNNLLPENFKGDKKTADDVATKIEEIINKLGQASANAQNLSQPITTAEKFINKDQNIYLLIDEKGQSGRGNVTGILKTGRKKLYLFDDKGEQKQVFPICLLDFYIHESQQRSGKGKMLFEHMLKVEHTQPAHLAIDRPSAKLLNFLEKHYGLSRKLPQSNNFVIYDGFFNNPKELPHVQNDRKNFGQVDHSDQSQLRQGRYPRPACSMGQIMQTVAPEGDVPPNHSTSTKPIILGSDNQDANFPTSSTRPRYVNNQQQSTVKHLIHQSCSVPACDLEKNYPK